MKTELVNEVLSASNPVTDPTTALSGATRDQLFVQFGIDRDGIDQVTPVKRGQLALENARSEVTKNGGMAGNLFEVPKRLLNTVRSAFAMDALIAGIVDSAGLADPTHEQLFVSELLTASHKVVDQVCSLCAPWHYVLRKGRREIWVGKTPNFGRYTVLATFNAPKKDAYKASQGLRSIQHLEELQEGRLARTLTTGLMADAAWDKYRIRFTDVKGASLRERILEFYDQILQKEKERNPIGELSSLLSLFETLGGLGGDISGSMGDYGDNLGGRFGSGRGFGLDLGSMSDTTRRRTPGNTFGAAGRGGFSRFDAASEAILH